MFADATPYTTPYFEHGDTLNTALAASINIDAAVVGGPRGPKYAVFAVVCSLNVLFSGGLIYGFGFFEAALVREGVFASHCAEQVSCDAQLNAISSIYSGGFEIMTFGTVLTAWLLGRLGPRRIAMLSFALSVAGNVVLGIAARRSAASASAGLWILGYGLVGMGGNSLFVSSLHFAQMFELPATAMALLTGLYNASSYVYVILHDPAVPVADFFFAYAVLTGLGLCVALIVYPGQQYAAGQGGCVFLWLPRLPLRCRHREHRGISARLSEMSSASDLADDIGPLMTTSDVLARAGGRFSKRRCEFLPLCRLELRFWLYLLTICWCAVVNAFIATYFYNIVSSKEGDGADTMMNWIFPFVGNAQFVFDPFLGWLVDKRGFGIGFALLMLWTQLSIACCWLPTVQSQWWTTIFYNLAGGWTYSVQYTYIFETYPAHLHSDMLAFTYLVQGVFQLIVYPGLSPKYPWGQDFTPPLLLMLIPTVPLYVCTWWHLRLQARVGTHQIRAGGSALALVRVRVPEGCC